jgi:hypothetical protein
MASRRFCHGYFTNEVKQLLREDNNAGGIAFLSQPCAACGASVLAENKAGEWVPKIHDAPSRRKVNTSGKSGYYKR